MKVSSSAEVIINQDVILRLTQKEDGKANKKRETEENLKKREQKKVDEITKLNEKKKEN